MNSPAARTVNLSRSFGRGEAAVTALEKVSLDIAAGEFTAIMGPSGSGKSTLMHCMAGLDSPTGGSAFIGDTDLAVLNDRDLTTLRRDRVGFVFQSFNLVPTLTAAENITLPADIAGRAVDADWYAEITGRLGLEGRLTHLPSELSGGQQQRVACARALVTRPEIVFADEPTGNLDTRSSSEVLDILRTAVDEFHQTVVTVTHDATAASVADRVVFLADGHVTEEVREPTAPGVLSVMTRIGEQ
ncbi:MAG: ABC transporter ATP-binding protein [Mycobacteriaceae bacterium]|uniref:ABC transporter ATP-binding protein n=1 Tax=Corynebacterium sp. TaxID=1720 RepID=UPI003F94641A